MKLPNRAILTTALLGLLTVLLTGCGGPNLISRMNNIWSYGICGTIVVILDILALLEVAGSSRGFGDKVLWALLIVFFPFGGLILYYLFGRS